MPLKMFDSYTNYFKSHKYDDNPFGLLDCLGMDAAPTLNTHSNFLTRDPFCPSSLSALFPLTHHLSNYLFHGPKCSIISN